MIEEFTARISAPNVMSSTKQYTDVKDLYNTLKVFVEEAETSDVIDIKLFGFKKPEVLIEKKEIKLTDIDEEVIKIIGLFPDSDSKLIIKELEHLSKWTIMHKLKSLTDAGYIQRNKNSSKKYLYNIVEQ